MSALDVRLAELRAKLDARVTPLPAEPSAPTPRTAPAPLAITERATDVESLALLVFNSLKGDPAKVKQLVHALGRLEAKSKATPAK